MEFERVVIARNDPKQGHNVLTSQHIYADVVFLNRTHHSLRPLLYQLKDRHITDLEQIAHTSQSSQAQIEKEVFFLMGEVLSIDKKKKQIYLSNQNTVAYQYLIVVSTMSDHPGNTMASEEQIQGGLHTLIAALKLKDRIVVPIPSVSNKEKRKQKIVATPDSPWSQTIRNHMTHPSDELISLSLIQPDKKLYQVQL